MSNTLVLAKFVAVGGLATWMTLIVFNNIKGFVGGVAAIGALMRMQLFDEPPVVKSVLLSRRVKSVSWHRIVLAFVLTLELASALLLWCAAISLAAILLAGATGAFAIATANVALSVFLATCFVMAIGGAWFAYYVKQEAAQITHFALIGVALGALILVNLGDT